MGTSILDKKYCEKKTTGGKRLSQAKLHQGQKTFENSVLKFDKISSKTSDVFKESQMKTEIDVLKSYEDKDAKKWTLLYEKKNQKKIKLPL